MWFLTCMLLVLLAVNAVLLFRKKKIPPDSAEPRCCRDCIHCKPVPEDAREFFSEDERHCAFGRGNDIWFGDSSLRVVSAVWANGSCSNFTPREQEVNAGE